MSNGVDVKDVKTDIPNKILELMGIRKEEGEGENKYIIAAKQKSEQAAATPGIPIIGKPKDALDSMIEIIKKQLKIKTPEKLKIINDNLDNLIENLKNKDISDIDFTFMDLLQKITEHLKNYKGILKEDSLEENLQNLIGQLFTLQCLIILNKIMTEPALDTDLLDLFNKLVKNLNNKLAIYNDILKNESTGDTKDIKVEGGGINNYNSFEFKYRYLLRIKNWLKTLSSY
jgi:hypothetical protein